MRRLNVVTLIACSWLLASKTFVEERMLFENLPEDFAVYAVGTGRGTLPVRAQLDDSKLEVTLANVVVNKPEKPVVLVLTAHDPVVWRVGRTKDTEIAAVLVSGHHGQALIGIKKDTPHAISTSMKQGAFPAFYAKGATDRLLKMNQAVKQLVGREIDYFENEAKQGVFYLGEKPTDAEGVVYSPDLKINGMTEPERRLVGRAGLETLVKEKKLRPATKADIEAWVEKASEKFKRFNPKLRVHNPMTVGRTYVVLEKLTLPDDLTGEDARSFIVPENVPVPQGTQGENSFYKMDGTKQEGLASTASAAEARYVFQALDLNKDGSLSSDEWSRSKTIRQGFENSGIAISLPIQLETFLERYPPYRLVPELRLPSKR